MLRSTTILGCRALLRPPPLAAGPVTRVARCLLASLLLASGTSAEPFAGYAGWRPVAGDTHRHGGTAYSVVALARSKSNKQHCPHEYGLPTAIYENAKSNGYDWLNLSFHVGVGPVYKPDGTPHRLVGSPEDPAYRWWTRPGAQPIIDSQYDYEIRPDPRGFPDFTTDGVISPSYNEALSLSSAARASTREGQFVAFAGREFTTATFTPHGGQPTQGGHKTVLFPGNTQSSCGLSRDPKLASSCGSELDLYRWAQAKRAVIIQAHPGNKPTLPLFSKVRAKGGFSDRYVQGMEVGKAGAFEPAWEAGYRHALRSGYRLFPAYGSDQHHLGGIGECPRGSPSWLRRGATVCWVSELSADGILDAMRARRCYYTAAHKPELRFEVGPTKDGEAASMGDLLTLDEKRARVRVDVRNDLRNQSDGKNAHRFERLEIVRVSASGSKVLARCDATGDERCRCLAEGFEGRDHCVFDGEVEIRKGALFARIYEPEGPMRCRDSPGRDCIGHPAVVVGAPIFVNWE